MAQQQQQQQPGQEGDCVMCKVLGEGICRSEFEVRAARA
jgi:hypothetical protein